MSDNKLFVKGNEFLKAPNHTEYITKEEYNYRIKEIAKCKRDPIYFAEKYFYIINPAKGKHVIKLYPKQEELIKLMCEKDRIVCVSSRQIGKTTAYNIFALWTALFHPEQSILICANTGDSASEFVSRIRLAYELIPMWLKPGVLEWNKRSLKFANESKIVAAPTSPGVRGKTGNVLIIDEAAFIDPGIEKEFWNAVYPTISSSKGTKCIMISTPNGTGNLFFNTYDGAITGTSDDGWHAFRIDWWEVPGHDEEWKKQQIASLGSLHAFGQEFGNCFYGSSATLINGTKIREFKEKIIKLQEQEYKPKLMNFHNRFDDDKYKLNIYYDKKPNNAYLIGADGAEGIGNDFSTILVFDISNIKNIKLVASYGNNEISVKEFAYILTKVAIYYNSAFVAIENNGITKGIIDDMWNIYEYDNFINECKYGKHGITSNNSIKTEACLWLKDLVQMDGDIKFDIKEPFLVQEMEFFERKSGARSSFQAVGNKHDDYMMSFVWAMYTINPNKIEEYYEPTKYFKTSFGLLMPEKVIAVYNDYQYSDSDIDKKFESTFNNGSTFSNNNNQGDDEFENAGFFGF